MCTRADARRRAHRTQTRPRRERLETDAQCRRAPTPSIWQTHTHTHSICEGNYRPETRADSLTHTNPRRVGCMRSCSVRRAEALTVDARRPLNTHEPTTPRMHARWFGPPSQRRSRSRSCRCSTQTASSRATTAAIHSAHLTVVVTRSCEEAIFLPPDDMAPPRRQLPLQRARLRPQPPLGRAAPDAARRGRCRCVHGIAATTLDGDERSVWCAWGIAATAMTTGERGDTAQPRADRAP